MYLHSGVNVKNAYSRNLLMFLKISNICLWQAFAVSHLIGKLVALLTNIILD
jgi:hypothetical protein